MRPWLPVALTGLVSAPVAAAELAVTIEIPRISIAEYHPPYVAIWVERPDQSVAANLAVWYSVKREKNEGAQWLRDLRQWWRRSGRDLTTPIDGVTGATRTPGRYELTFSGTARPMASLPPGSYQLVVEAAREVGGRELLKVPFTWPAPAQSPQTPPASAKGETELESIVVHVRP